MRLSRPFVLLPLLLSALFMTQCSRPNRYPGDSAADRTQRRETGENATPSSGPVAFPSGISPSGGRGNDAVNNPNNPQTNPRTNLDGTQSSRPDDRKPTPN
jgi:hypothetical protein